MSPPDESSFRHDVEPLGQKVRCWASGQTVALVYLLLGIWGWVKGNLGLLVPWAVLLTEEVAEKAVD